MPAEDPPPSWKTPPRNQRAYIALSALAFAWLGAWLCIWLWWQPIDTLIDNPRGFESSVEWVVDGMIGGLCGAVVGAGLGWAARRSTWAKPLLLIPVALGIVMLLLVNDRDVIDCTESSDPPACTN